MLGQVVDGRTGGSREEEDEEHHFVSGVVWLACLMISLPNLYDLTTSPSSHHGAGCSLRGTRRLGVASVVAPPVDIRKYFSRVENKMSEGTHKILSATKTIAKQSLHPRPQVAGSAALIPLLAEAASEQSREDTAKNEGKISAEKMGRAVAGAATTSSTAPAAPEYAVRPCRAGMSEWLSVAKGQLGPRPPKWPVPTESGLWFTSHYASCPKLAARTGDCWWRTKKAGTNAAKHPAGIECDRKVRSTKDGKREGETATDARNRRDEAHGVTPTEARIQRYKAAGRTRADDEFAYTLKHGFPRASHGGGYGNVACTYLP
jgi:hypothetical protein